MNEAAISNAKHEESAASDTKLAKRAPANACVCGDKAEQRRELGAPFMRKHKKDVTSDTKLATPWCG